VVAGDIKNNNLVKWQIINILLTIILISKILLIYLFINDIKTQNILRHAAGEHSQPMKLNPRKNYSGKIAGH
jgi:hypothetical protein